MPYYDLRCAACNLEFNHRASVAEKSEKHIPCPACGSTELETVYKGSSAAIMKSSGSAAECPNAHICGAACRH
ncbi:MAG TPA: FmdB family zinc ribbon protein [Clostridia bacterium]